MLKIVNSTISLLLLLLLTLLEICDSSMALKLNLTESCSGNQLKNCVLFNISATLNNPLSVVDSNQNELTQLVIRNAIILRIPRELFNRVPNLQTFAMHDCSLTRIDNYDFQKATQLRLLLLQQNRLSTIPEEIFGSLSLLEELFLGSNTIHTVHSTAFDGLSHLRTLDLQQNSIHELPEHLFTDLINLEYIDLSNNQIEKIDSSTFAMNLNLKTVILKNNKFTVFEPDSLYHINHLNFLDVSNCNLEELNVQSVESLYVENSELKYLNVYGALQKLRAGNNNLNSINVTDEKSVHHLELHANSFHSLDDFVKMSNLQYLDISKNHITSLTTKKSPLFVPLPILTHLNLAFNRLRNLSSDNFLLLHKLTHLDLAFNHLNSLDVNVLKPLHMLEKLFIDGNNLRTFDYSNFLSGHNYVKEIALHGNAWDFHFLREMLSFLNQHSLQIVNRVIAGGNLGGATHSSTASPNGSGSNYHYSTSEASIIAHGDSVTGTPAIDPHAGDALAILTLVLVFIVLTMQVFRSFRDEHNNWSFCRRSNGRLREEQPQVVRRQRLLEEETSEV